MTTSSQYQAAGASGRIVVWGAGGHAKVVADILRLNGFEIAGFLDQVDPQRHGESFCGARVLGGPEVLQRLYADGIRQAFVAFGNNARRISAVERLESHGFQIVSSAHPSATLGTDVNMGAGSIITAGAIVNPSTTIGRAVIINTGASVDHDCVIGDGASVGPGALLAGNVTVGKGAFIGIGATIIENIRIGAGSIVGAGAVVIADVPDSVVVVGVPARFLRPAQEAQSSFHE